jgi:IS5 family transposase
LGSTTQEAKIPYPNEVGLMSRYASMMGKCLKKAGEKFTKVNKKLKKATSKIKGLVRNSHLFAKTKEAKRKVAKKLLHLISDIHEETRKVIFSSSRLKSKSLQEISRLTEVMEKLIPQMRHFIETGFVASKKIIHLMMTELYSIVRGKSGKPVEFGIKWGINRLKGGFLQGFLIEGGKHVSDKRFCIEALKVFHREFGQIPKTYGFDRGGYSRKNLKKALKFGVKYVGIAPKGKDKWAVSDTMQTKIKRERAQVEGSIGTIKSPIYGFNKPDARSTRAMVSYGHRAILGFNLRKLIREQAKLQMVTT